MKDENEDKLLILTKYYKEAHDWRIPISVTEFEIYRVKKYAIVFISEYHAFGNVVEKSFKTFQDQRAKKEIRNFLDE